MALDAPLIVSVPLLELKLPLTDKFPVRVNEVEVLTAPLIVRLSLEIPEPFIVLPEPVIVSVPPEPWLKEPAPVVARLPVKLILEAEKLIAEAAIVRLLKF